MSASLKRKQSVCVTALICVVALSACTDGDYYEILDEYGNVADPRTLSAGKSTVFQSGVSAYDTPADWVTGQSEHAVLPRRRAVRQSARQRRRSGAGRQGASVCGLLVRQLPLERRKNLSDALLGGRNRQRGILVAPDLHHEKERRILPQLRTRAARSGDHRSRAGRQARRNLFGEDLHVPRRGGILAADADLHDFGVVCRQHRRRGPDRRRADSAAARRHGADDGARPDRARRTRTAQQLSRIRHFGPPELHHRARPSNISAFRATRPSTPT